MLRSSVFVAALAGLLVASVSASAQQPAPAPKVLVFPFAALGDEGRTNADLLRKNLINAIDLMNEVDAVDPAAAEQALGRPLAEARDACAEEVSCMTALAQATGARFLVKGGVLVEAAGGYTVTLQAFDTASGTLAREPESQKVPNEAAAAESMRKAAAWMFATTGTLVLETPVPADVLIDSRPLGRRTPADRAVSLPVRLGKVSVRLEAAGYEPFDTTVEIRPGRATTLKPDMKRKPQSVAARPTPTPVVKKPLTRRPLFWGAVAAGVVAIGAGAAVAASQGGGGGGTEVRDGTPAQPGTAITIIGN